MAYVDSSGQTHVSYEEASRGYVAKTTASRDAAGNVVGDSAGSRYVRQQEAEKEQAAQQAQQIQQPQQTGFLYPSMNDQFQQEKAAIVAEQALRQQQTQQNPGLWERTISTFKTGYDAGRSGNMSLSDIKDLSGPGWGVEGAIAGKVVSAGVGIIGEDRLKAYNAGYEMGRGRSADISGLQAPNQGKDKMITAPLYEWTDNLTGGLSAYQNVLVRPIPGGIRPIVTGLSDIPIIFIDTIGKAPMGVETIVRNPTSSIDSIGLGYGVLAGGIVTMGEKEPLRLAGQLAGGYILGKGAGAAYSKVKPGLSKGLSKQGLNEFAKSEEGTFNLKGTKAGRQALEEWDKIDSAKAAEPAYEFAEDSYGNVILKEVPAQKIPTSPAASKIPEPKLSKYEAGQKRGWDIINRGASQGGGDNVLQSSNGMKLIMKTELKQELKTTPKIAEDIKTIDLTDMKTPDEISAARLNSFKAEQKRLDSLDRLHTHLEQSIFERTPVDITPFTPKIKTLKTLKTGSKMTQAQKNAFARKQKEETLEIPKAVQKEEILEIPKAAQKEEILEIPKIAQKEKVTQDILSIPKLTETQKYSEIQIADILEIPKAAQKEKVTQDIFSIPKLTETQKYSEKQIADILEIPKVAQKEKESWVFIPLLSYDLPFAAQDFSIPVTQKQRNKEKIIPVVNIPDVTTDIPIIKINKNKKHNPDPWTPDPWSPDPIPPDPIPPNPIPPDPIPPDPIPPDPIPPDPWEYIPPPPKNITIPKGGDWDFSRDLDSTPQKRRKTKKKMLKNIYGDPLKIKLNL